MPLDDLDLDNQTDEAVFSHFQQGNPSALGVLYDRYGLLVYRLLFRMLNDCQEAEDLTQEIFLSLLQSSKYDPNRGSFYTYLMMLARSRTLDKIRSRRSKNRFLQDKGKMKDLIGKASFISPIEKISLNETTQQVREALAALSTNQRQVLELSYYQGLSQSEIAKRLNLPLGTVKTHSRRGLLQLRKNLQNLVK
ncbi:MAG: sigma-70 family RNA polymerase sigma factor [Microcystaceae cyanobacterium]